MEDFYMNSTSQDESTNTTFTTDDGSFFRIIKIIDTGAYVIIGIGLPLTLITIYGLCSLVRKDDVAPIYVINLLISDLIQLCCMTVRVSRPTDMTIRPIIGLIYIYSLMVSVGFMVCIALERYLVIAWPLWYRFRRTIKTSVVVCVVVWALPLISFSAELMNNDLILTIAFNVFFLLPLPLFIFFLVGTLKALSASNSVTSDEKRRIVGMMVLVLLLYILIFLPLIIAIQLESINETFLALSHTVPQLNPLADLLLYIFMRKGMIDKFLASVCCCRMDSNDTSTSLV